MDVRNKLRLPAKVRVIDQSLELTTVSWMSEDTDDELTDDVDVPASQQLSCMSTSSSDDVDNDD